LVKYNSDTGNILSKKVFGGTNSDIFKKIIKINNNRYVVVGTTYSNNGHLKNFNKGHSDALLVSYDINFNLSKIFQEPVIIIDRLKSIQPNYGTELSLKYDNIYTSNDSKKDFGNWCTSVIPYLEEDVSNYYYGICLRPFNEDEIKSLTFEETNRGMKPVYIGENEYSIDIDPDYQYNWHKIFLDFAGHTPNIEISNLKLKFADGYIGSINGSINTGRIEPLVTISNRLAPAYRLFPTIIDIVNDGGTTGLATLYPQLHIHLKPKSTKLVSVIFTSSRDSVSGDGVRIEELRNFDMSITPTN
jgi:hypothetical protein